MKKSILLFLMVGIILPFLNGQQQIQSRILVITHVAVIDATGKPVKADMTVVIEDDRIKEIAPARKVQVTQGANLIDGTGKFLIPGLWDMHVHLFGATEDFSRLCIANGITGVRIMWGAPTYFQSRKDYEAGSSIGPRLFIGSPLVDGPKPIWPGSMSVSNEAEARQAVIKLKHDGYDFIKVYSLVPRDAYFALADEAKKQGIEFDGHVPYSVSVSEASDCGQRSIEHLTGILAESSTHEQALRKGYDEAFSNLPPSQRIPGVTQLRVLNRMLLEDFSAEKARTLFSKLARNHTWQCPTFTVLRSLAFLDDADFKNDGRLKYVPTALKNLWDPANDFRSKEKTPEDFKLSKLLYQRYLELVPMMQKAGVEFLAGTDSPNPYCFPGFSLHDELALLVQAGMSPMAALQAATLNPARFLKRDKDLGTVEVGKLADLVLLEGNPLADIRNTRGINAVVLRGKLIPKSELDQMLFSVQASVLKK